MLEGERREAKTKREGGLEKKKRKSKEKDKAQEVKKK